MRAAKRIFYMIDRKSKIDPSEDSGEKLEEVKGVIEFKNIFFTYPHRPEMPVIKGLNLTINPGESVALVGQSGCGKSTLTQLVSRFYDPDEGEILLDGVDIKKLNVMWLRNTLGLVQQEPV